MHHGYNGGRLLRRAVIRPLLVCRSHILPAHAIIHREYSRDATPSNSSAGHSRLQDDPLHRLQGMASLKDEQVASKRLESQYISSTASQPTEKPTPGSKAEAAAQLSTQPSVQPASNTYALRTQRQGRPRPKIFPHHFKNSKKARDQTEPHQTPAELVKELDFTPEQIRALPLELLYNALQAFAGQGFFKETYDHVHKMLVHRLEPPSVEMFRALIMVNAAPEGSVDRVMHLLKEIEDEKIALDQSVCDAVFRVLSVHPDHVLRIEILQHMERRWYGLSEQAHQLFVAGLFRSLQFEQAVQEMQTMKLNSLRMENWLFTLAISTLVEAEEFDEAMKVMRLRLEHAGNAHSTALWTYLLDSAAAAHHFITCRYIWVRCVLAEYITVSSGTCLHLLTMAARKGDVDFALDIVRVVKRYHFGLEFAHWELLVETYATAGMLEQAFNAMVDMHSNKFTPAHFTTRPIYKALQSLPAEMRDDTCLELYDYLLNRQSLLGRLVPAAAVNVLMECCSHAQSAYDMYHNIRMVCRSGPDAATFHHLLTFTTQEKDAKRALVFAEEHKLMGYEPGLVVYDGLLMSLIQGKHDMDEIMHIYDEMRSVFKRPVFRTVAALYIALRVTNDPRAPEVFSHLHRRDANTTKLGELPVRLQKLRLEAAAEVSKAKGRRLDRPAQILMFPPGADNNLQSHIEDLQVETQDISTLAIAKLNT